MAARSLSRVFSNTTLFRSFLRPVAALPNTQLSPRGFSTEFKLQGINFGFGADGNHWLIRVKKPDDNLTRDQIIDSYIKLLAIVLGRGYKRFFRRAMLESSDYPKDDCLKINCTVGVVVCAIDCSRFHSIQVPESDIGAHLGTLLDNMEGSDITFNVAGEKFLAHNLVLAARSPVFRSEFSDKLVGDEQEVSFTDMEPTVLKRGRGQNENIFCINQALLCNWCPYR